MQDSIKKLRNLGKFDLANKLAIILSRARGLYDGLEGQARGPVRNRIEFPIHAPKTHKHVKDHKIILKVKDSQFYGRVKNLVKNLSGSGDTTEAGSSFILNNINSEYLKRLLDSHGLSEVVFIYIAREPKPVEKLKKDGLGFPQLPIDREKPPISNK